MIGTLSAVDPTLCQKIQCGLITQSQVGWQTLLECSQAGYAGVRSALDPVCQELAGGGPVTVVEEQIAQSSQDPQPDEPDYYQPDPQTGTPQVWYQFPTEATTESEVASQSGQYDGATEGERPLSDEAPAGEEFDIEAYRNLIGDPRLRFREKFTPVTKMIKDWAEVAIDQVKRLPWWVWLIAAAAIYQVARKKR